MKNRMMGVLIILIVIIISMVVGFKIGSKKNEESKDLKKGDTCYSYVLVKTTHNANLKEVIIIYTFDKKDVCVDCRMMYDYETEELARKEYDKWIDNTSGIVKNIKIDSAKVIYNATNFNGKMKDEILNSFASNIEYYVEVF